MRHVFLLAVLLTANSTSAPAEQLSQGRYFNAVFTGDLSWVAGLDPASNADNPLYRNFRARFVDHAPPEEWDGIEDDVAREAALLYRDYWTAALLDPANRETAEQALAASLDGLLQRHEVTAAGDDAFERLADALRSRGWGFQGGRTPPLQDFMLWRQTTSREYTVQLTDRQQSVRVHFLDDFISAGWSNFATFGRAGTGGWADQEALYCIQAHYRDLEAERFRIAYLTHEARHFADYDLYPKLKPVDLEYRAKLTQLYYAESEGPHYLDQFRAHAGHGSDAPHPRANWQVLNDLGGELGIDAFDSQAVQSRPWPEVARAALELLDRHDAALREAGAGTTEGVL